MEDEEIQKGLLKVLEKQFDIPKDKISLDADFRNDLKMDSLDHYDYLNAVEEEFHLDIPEEDERLIGIRNARDLFLYLKENYKL